MVVKAETLSRGLLWKEESLSHYGRKQPRIQTVVLGHSLVRSLVRSHRSLVRFARALCCAHSFARWLTLLNPSLVGKWIIRWLFFLCFFLFFTIVYRWILSGIFSDRMWQNVTECDQRRQACQERNEDERRDKDNSTQLTGGWTIKHWTIQKREWIDGEVRVRSKFRWGSNGWRREENIMN